MKLIRLDSRVKDATLISLLIIIFFVFMIFIIIKKDKVSDLMVETFTCMGGTCSTMIENFTDSNNTSTTTTTKE